MHLLKQKAQLLILALGLSVPGYVLASDLLDGNTADTWVINNSNGDAAGSYNVGGVGVLRTKSVTPGSASSTIIREDDSDIAIIGVNASTHSIIVNKFEGSYPVQNSVLGLPKISLTGLSRAVSDVANDHKPGITVTPAAGTYNRTVEFKMQGISGRDNLSAIQFNWKINDGTTQNIIPVADPELGAVHSFFLVENGTYSINAWTTQGGTDSEHQIGTYIISGTDYQRDTDGDGIPDVFEIEHGLNPLVADLNQDSDGDGWSDLDELLRFTLPDDADSFPGDLDGDGWSNYDENVFRGTNYNDDTELVDAGVSDTPSANRLYEVEYLITDSAVYDDAAELTKRTFMGPLTAYDIDADRLFSSSELLTQTEYDALDAVSESPIPNRFYGTLANAQLQVGNYPLLRLPAGKPFILRSQDALQLEWVSKRWIDSIADPAPGDVTQWDIDNGAGSWSTPDGWLFAYRSYLVEVLTKDVSALNMSPATGLGVALIEGVLSWHAGLEEGATILLGHNVSADYSSASNSVQSMLTVAGSNWNILHADMVSLTTSGSKLDAFAGDVAAYYASPNALPFIDGSTTKTIPTTTQAAAALLQGPGRNTLYEYRLRLAAVHGLATIDPLDFDFLMEAAIDFDGDGFFNADELAPQFGFHTLPYEADSDGDFIPDNEDPCPADSENLCLTLLQQNADSDGDGLIDSIDNCLNDANADQTDTNNDGIGDACRFYANITTPTTHMTIWLGESINFASVVTELGTGKTLQFDWNFDTAVANQSIQDPGSVIFSSSGTFNVVLTVFDIDTGLNLGSDTRTITVLGTAPTIDIGGPYAVLEGDVVVLNAATTSYGGNINWTLGDEGFSSVNPLNYIYEQQGNFNIEAIVTDAFGNSAADATTINVSDSVPVAAFTQNITSGDEPLSVNFTDQSTAYDGIVTYAWNFGNGDSSAQASPIYIFQNDGVFDVTLTVTDGDGSAVESVAQQITVNAVGGVSLATDLVSVDVAGVQGTNISQANDISTSGRYVAFASAARNLVPGDTNFSQDIFLKDMQTGAVSIVSTNSSGGLANNHSYAPAISSDGRYVTFYSDASNLVAGDTNSRKDIFHKDTLTGVLIRVSVSSAGAQSDGQSWWPSISGDGRYVAYHSDAINLVASDTNGLGDIFFYDTQTGDTRRISTTSSGAQASGDSDRPSVSFDGRYVAFSSTATDLVTGDTTFASDIVIKDTQTGAVSIVSTDSAGNQKNVACSAPDITPDGRYVVFNTSGDLTAINVSNTNAYIKDTVTNTTVLASIDASGTTGSIASAQQPSISDDGRFVTFWSSSTVLVSNDTNGKFDIFIHDKDTGVTTIASASENGTLGDANSYTSNFSGNGRYVVYGSDATNLVDVDVNGQRDVFRSPNPAYSVDTDGDGLTDAEEVALGTDLNLADTDGDTLNDGDEVNTYGTDPLLADSDLDGFDDGEEVAAGTDPNNIFDFPVTADGDVNNDGTVNVIDIMLVTRHVLNQQMLTAEQILRADVAPLSGGTPVPDGVVTAADLLVIQRKALGVIDF